MAEVAAWFHRPLPRPGARLRLVCLPCAGGGTAVFRGWPARLPADVELLAVRLPGRESRIRERPYRDGEPLTRELARLLTEEVRPPYHAAWCYERGGPGELPVTECSMAKLYTTELACRVADLNLHLQGSHGYRDDTAAARAYRDSRAAIRSRRGPARSCATSSARRQRAPVTRPLALSP